jgi:hypothetical protein
MTGRATGAMRRAALAGAAALALAGCESGTDYTPDLRVLEPSQPREPEMEMPEEVVTRPVAEVLSVELGAMRRGRLLLVEGAAPATGWFLPRLQPRREGRPGPDGFLDFDFVAAPPALNGGAESPRGTPAQRRLKAARPLTPEDLAGAVGVRVHAGGGAAARRFVPEG